MKENTDKFATMKKGQSFEFEMKAVADMTFANNFSTADASVAFVRPGIIELPKRKLHIRELLTGGGMGNKSTFDYVKEIAGEGAPATAAEGATKSQFDLDLQEVSVKAEWIAGFIKISRNMLDDVEGMTTFLGSRLPELLLRTEDAQILNGNGTSPNLSGITNTGNFTAFGGAATIDIEQLVQAISQLEALDREANGILLNPADYYNIMLTKASGSGEYDFPSLVQITNGQMFVAGVPVYKSTAMTVDKFLVGDWRMGANLIFREPAKVQFFYEDGTNAQQNKVTVRVEERVALPIYGNDYFIYGDFGNVA
jgi:HK97 family phage major capsid protein